MKNLKLLLIGEAEVAESIADEVPESIADYEATSEPASESKSDAVSRGKSKQKALTLGDTVSIAFINIYPP